MLKDGFNMMQFSVYTRHYASMESAEVHLKRVKKMIPPKGNVSILRITDKQYSNILNFWGTKTTPLEKGFSQLELF